MIRTRTLRAALPGALLVLLLALLLPGPAARAGGVDDPWLVGLDFLGNHVDDDEDDDELRIEEDGGGGALQFGYRFTPRFLLRFYASGARHGTDRTDVDITFAGALIEAAYVFRPDTALRPYLFGGVGGYQAESEQGSFTYSTEGPGASLGAGLFYDFNEHVALHSSVRLEAVNWDKLKVSYDTTSGRIDAEIPIDDSGSAAKFTLGVAFAF